MGVLVMIPEIRWTVFTKFVKTTTISYASCLLNINKRNNLTEISYTLNNLKSLLCGLYAAYLYRSKYICLHTELFFFSMCEMFAVMIYLLQIEFSWKICINHAFQVYTGSIPRSGLNVVNKSTHICCNTYPRNMTVFHITSSDSHVS